MASPPPEETLAAHRVFNTTELLEQILLNLDTKTLLLSTRTNRRFKNVIDGSLHLQQALFFKPAPGEIGQRYGNYGANPLLNNTGQFGNFLCHSYPSSPGQVDIVWTTAQPKLRKKGHKAPASKRRRTGPPAPADRREASWRRMYPTHRDMLPIYMCQASILMWLEDHKERTAAYQQPIPEEPLTMSAYEELGSKNKKQLVKIYREGQGSYTWEEEMDIQLKLRGLWREGVLDDKEFFWQRRAKRSRW